MVKLTCVELPDSPTQKTWNSFARAILELNEMPLYPWFVLTKGFEIKIAEDAVWSHDESMSILNELGCKHMRARDQDRRVGKMESRF